MSIAEKRALITGIQGFTGRYMAAELVTQGCEGVGTVQVASRPKKPIITKPISLIWQV